LRSSLTIAIIAVGIMSLTSIQTAIEVFSGELAGSFDQFGANTLTIEKKEEAKRDISLVEAREFCRLTESASVSRTLMVAASVAAGGAASDPVAQIVASDANYLLCNGLHLSEGRNFSPSEVSGGASVCLVGSGIANKLFGSDESASGQSVSFGKGEFRIVGVIARSGISFGGGGNCDVIIPLDSSVSFPSQGGIGITVRTSGTEEEKLLLAARMRNIRNATQSEDDEFVIRSADAVGSTFSSIKSKLSAAALAVGLITMLGAAVGLMNIMLVSVSERRGEIGLRKAVGASSRDVLTQFLTESLMVGTCGAAAGILLGIIAGNCVALALECSLRIPWRWISASIVLTALVSILSGLIPARKAAILEPVEALRE